MMRELVKRVVDLTGNYLTWLFGTFVINRDKDPYTDSSHLQHREV